MTDAEAKLARVMPLVRNLLDSLPRCEDCDERATRVDVNEYYCDHCNISDDPGECDLLDEVDWRYEAEALADELKDGAK